MRCTDGLLPESHRQGLMMSEEEEGMRARKRWQFQVSVHCAGAGVRMGHIAGGVGAGSPLSASVIRLPLLTGPEGGTWPFSPGVMYINFSSGSFA